MVRVEVSFEPVHHLDDGVRVRGEHPPLEGHDLFVVLAPHAVQRHRVLGLDDQVLASVGLWRTVRVIWRESVMSVWENQSPQQGDVCGHVVMEGFAL